MPLAATCGLLAAGGACGKKGPPLAPIIRLPATVDGFTVRRIGGAVYIRLGIPRANVDQSTPADLDRVEIWGYTGIPGPNDNLVRRGTLVGTIPVRPPPPPGAQPAGSEPPPGGRAPSGNGVALHDQGDVVTIVEPLTPATLAEVPVLPVKTARAPESDPRANMLLWSEVPGVPVRIYTAVGVSRKGRRGPFAPRVAVPLVPPTAPPPEVKVSFSERAVTLAWAPSPGGRRPVQSPAPGTNLPSTPRTLGLPATRYNVYLAGGPTAVAGDALGAPSSVLISAPPSLGPDVVARPAATVARSSPSPVPAMLVPGLSMPAPLNEKPLEVPGYESGEPAFGEERCYVIRAVDSYGSAPQEGPGSAPACVTPKDVFPPAAPRNLAAVSSGGAVSLIWEPNSEPDLAGYLVLRAEAGNDTLQPLTPAPVSGTTYRDTAARPGVRYVYAVVALDRATPPNVSGLSNRVEEMVR